MAFIIFNQRHKVVRRHRQLLEDTEKLGIHLHHQLGGFHRPFLIEKDVVIPRPAFVLAGKHRVKPCRVQDRIAVGDACFEVVVQKHGLASECLFHPKAESLFVLFHGALDGNPEFRR